MSNCTTVGLLILFDIESIFSQFHLQETLSVEEAKAIYISEKSVLNFGKLNLCKASSFECQ